MKSVLVVVLVLVAALFAVGYWLAHSPAALAVGGVLLLLAAALAPRRRSCSGTVLHCSGCNHH